MTVQFDRLEDKLAVSSAPVGFVHVSYRGGLYRNLLKRVFDVALIVVAVPFILPVILILSLCVALDGGNPFYRSTRVGRNGRDFGMLKLRTMVPKASEQLELHLENDADARAEWDATQKLKNDPRITRFGRFLRKTSLDELPQLWNVLVGDMSIVGPRPMLPEQREIYPGLAYYALRPGITGSWQVSDRNNSAFRKRAEYDRDYDAELTFVGDVKLILKTVGVVFRGTGY